MRLIRLHKGAFWLAVAATVAAVGLAGGGTFRGRYDPNLAVLTATLVAVIWYTFFSYCAIHRTEASRLNWALQRSPGKRMVEVYVENVTAGRRISLRCRLLGWRDHAPMTLHSTLTGDDWFTLKPGEPFVRNFPVPDAKGTAPWGPKVQLCEPAEAIMRLDIAWRDDLGDAGSLGPEYYALDVLDCEVRRYQSDAEAKRTWTALGGGSVGRLAR